MANRVTGLSGMDTEGMVQKLMMTEQEKVDKLYKQRTLLTWQQEAYRNFTTQIQSFQSKFLSFTNPLLNLKSSAFFNMKNFSVTAGGVESKGITVKGSSSGKNIEHKIAVKQIASAQRMEGTAASGGYSKRFFTGDINVDDLKSDMWVELNLDGKKTRLSVGDLNVTQTDIDNGINTKMDKLVNNLNNQLLSSYGAGMNGTPQKVAVKASGNALAFETEAGRSLSVTGFGNGYTAGRSFTYDANTTPDTLSFEIKPLGTDGDGNPLSAFNINVNTYKFKDSENNTYSFSYDENGIAVMVDNKGNTFDTSGNFIKDKDGNTTGNNVDFDQMEKVKLTASELAKSITDTLNAKGVNEKNANGKYNTNFYAESTGNSIRIGTDNTTVKYEFKETTQIANADKYKAAEDTSGNEILITAADGVYKEMVNEDGGTAYMKVKDAKGNDVKNTQIYDLGSGVIGDPNNPPVFKVRQVDEKNQHFLSTLTTITDSPLELYGKTASELGVNVSLTTDNSSKNTLAQELGATNANLNSWTIKANGKTYIFGADPKDDTTVKGAVYLGLTEKSTINDMINAVNGADAGIKASRDAISGKYVFESTKMGELYGFDMSSELEGAFGLSEKASAQDAIIKINGIETSRETNEITFEGTTIVLNESAAGNNDYGDEITIKSTSDVDKMVESIKTFINEYNTLLTSLNTSYNERRVKTQAYGYYEPLTDEEKAAMNEKDIEKWEEQAKVGILSRDSSLDRLISSMRNVMTKSIDLGNGKSLSLSQIGISSGDWRDLGALQIDEAKLRKALEERPEDVALMFNKESKTPASGDRRKRDRENGIAYLLDDVMADATRRSPVNGFYGYFIDKAGLENSAKVTENDMSKKIRDINDRIYKLEQTNLLKENQYYAMFAQMEKAIMQSQQQMQSIGLG